MSGQLHLAHRLVRFEQKSHRVVLHFITPHGEKTTEAAYLLGCDGGRSTVREHLGIPVSIIVKMQYSRARGCEFTSAL